MKILKFLSFAIKFDLIFLRTGIFIFIFNLIPNLYLLKHLKCFVLKLSGINLKINSAFILAPLIVDLSKNISIGKGVFINKFVHFDGNEKIIIGNNCQIGPFCKFYTTNHDNKKLEYLPISLGNNIWLGSNCIILPGVKIKDNVKIAAGSIVNKNITYGKLWGGVPAKCIKE